MWNEVAVDQPKTGMRVGAEADEAAIGSIAAVEAAMTAEVAGTWMTVASSAVVAATAVVAMVPAAAVAAVQAGLFFVPQPRWRFPRAHRTSPLGYPRLLDVTAAPEAAVL